MEVVVKQADLAGDAAYVVIVNLCQGVTVPAGATGAADVALNGAIREVIAAGDFTGKAGETVVLYPRGQMPARRVLVVGLGEADKFNLAGVRHAAAVAARKARDLGAQTVATIVHGATDTRVRAS